MDNTKRNIQAEAFADQVRAAIRQDEEIPDGPICAAAARTIKTDGIKSPEFAKACETLLNSWAEEHGVDRPE